MAPTIQATPKSDGLNVTQIPAQKSDGLNAAQMPAHRSDGLSEIQMQKKIDYIERHCLKLGTLSRAEADKINKENPDISERLKAYQAVDKRIGVFCIKNGDQIKVERPDGYSSSYDPSYFKNGNTVQPGHVLYPDLSKQSNPLFWEDMGLKVRPDVRLPGSIISVQNPAGAKLRMAVEWFRNGTTAAVGEELLPDLRVGNVNDWTAAGYYSKSAINGFELMGRKDGLLEVKCPDGKIHHMAEVWFMNSATAQTSERLIPNLGEGNSNDWGARGFMSAEAANGFRLVSD